MRKNIQLTISRIHRIILLYSESSQTDNKVCFFLFFLLLQHLAWKLYEQQESATSSPLIEQQQGAISHWFPIRSLPSHLLGSQWCSPFEADLIPHICTSIFLKRADYDCFDPFHKRKLRPQQPATPKREVIASRSSLQIFSWLTWEHVVRHLHWRTTFLLQTSWTWKAQGCWLKNWIRTALMFSLADFSWITYWFTIRAIW